MNETLYNYVSRNSTLDTIDLIVSSCGCGFWASRHIIRTKCQVECCTGHDYGPMNTCHVSYITQHCGAIQIRAPETGASGWSIWLSITTALSSGFTRSRIDLSLCDTRR